jgi:hypothetical protein
MPYLWINFNQLYVVDSDTKKGFIKQASNGFQKVKDEMWTSNLSLMDLLSKNVLKLFLSTFLVVVFIRSLDNNLLTNGWKIQS